MAVHQRNLARSVQRGAEQHRLHDVDRRWNASPALLKTRPGNRPASAAGLTPQTHARALVRADERVPPKPEFAKRLGGAEDLMYELGASPTPLGQLRTPTGPPSMVTRTERLGRMTDKGVVRHGYTHRVRAVLWGTSLGQYQQVVETDDVDSASTLGTGGRRRRQQRESSALGSAAGQADDPAAPGYEYHDLHKMARSRVLNALITDRRQRTDEGVLREAEAAWKSIPARRQDGRLASTLCCLMHDLGVERAKIDGFYAGHCSKSERDRIAASKQSQTSSAQRGREGAGTTTPKNGKLGHLDLVASTLGLSEPSGPLKSSFGAGASFESSNR